MTVSAADLLEAPTIGEGHRTHHPVAAVLAILVVAALFPNVFTDIDPLATATRQSQRPPNAEHLFGTDRLGRDVYSRVVHGAGLSLSFGFSATLLALKMADPVTYEETFGTTTSPFFCARSVVFDAGM